MEIRSETPADHRDIYEVEAAAFGGDLQAEIVEALRVSADPQLSLVATIDGNVVGHIFFSPGPLDAHPGTSAAQLSPIAVDPSYQGQGVGAALMREGLGLCDEMGWQLVFLLGDPRYYSRFGFKLAAPLGFTSGDPNADLALQVYEVRPGAFSDKGGRVRFHPAFDVAESSRMRPPNSSQEQTTRSLRSLAAAQRQGR